MVSPDGEAYVSSNNSGSNPIEVYEIKFPIPGNKFRPDVHYAIPKYYVTQLLAEMYATKCDTMIYMSYSKTSSTVFEVKFDRELWELIQTRLLGRPQPQMYPPVALNQYTLVNRTHKHYIYASRPHKHLKITPKLNNM